MYEWMDKGTGITQLIGTSWNSAHMPQNSFRWESTQEKSKVLTTCMSTKERWYTVSIQTTLQTLTSINVSIRCKFNTTGLKYQHYFRLQPLKNPYSAGP